ncbi:MAG: hypothetical protein ABFD04_00620 [Syntrophomonas sp.]
MENKKCIYCGENATTKDHVPPYSFFSKPAPNNLITVPSCLDCNNSFSNDEEYFRTIIASARSFGEENVPHDVWNRVERSLNRNKRLLYQINESFRNVDIYSGKIYLGKRPAFKIDRNRADKVVGKIIKGLFYNEYGIPLAKEYMVKVLLNDEDKIIPREIFDVTASTPVKELGDGVLRYRNACVETNQNYSVWALSFYMNDSVTWICLTGKPSDH